MKILISLAFRTQIAMILLLFVSFEIVSQNKQMDSVFIKKSISEYQFEVDTQLVSSVSFQNVLVGTTFLPYSEKMISLLNNGLAPIRFSKVDECNKEILPTEFKEYPQYNMIERGKNTLTIEVKVIANCCHNFLGEAEVIEKDILRLSYTSYGGFCSCDCCYTLRYEFDTTMEETYQTLKTVTLNSSNLLGKIPSRK